MTYGGQAYGNAAYGSIAFSFPPPTNVRITDASTEGELTLDWDETNTAVGYYVYRAQVSGSTIADYTQVADVTTPPYTDTTVEDGEKYYYRVSAYD